MFSTIQGRSSVLTTLIIRRLIRSAAEKRPPNGLLEPVRGFGKVWRNFSGVRDGLGWATAQESGTNAVIQDFAMGRMMYIAPRTDTFIIINQGNPTLGNWRAAQGTF